MFGPVWPNGMLGKDQFGAKLNVLHRASHLGEKEREGTYETYVKIIGFTASIFGKKSLKDITGSEKIWWHSVRGEWKCHI